MTWARSAALVSLLAASACGPDRAPRTVDDELGRVPATAARVCVLRPESLADGMTMEVRDNGRLVGATRGSTFVCWLAAPGEHQISSVDDDTGPVLFRAGAGGHYWLHQEVSLLGAHVHAHLDWVDDAAAADMLDACQTRVRVAVPGYTDNPKAVAVSPKL